MLAPPRAMSTASSVSNEGDDGNQSPVTSAEVTVQAEVTVEDGLEGAATGRGFVFLRSHGFCRFKSICRVLLKGTGTGRGGVGSVGRVGRGDSSKTGMEMIKGLGGWNLMGEEGGEGETGVLRGTSLGGESSGQNKGTGYLIGE